MTASGQPEDPWFLPLLIEAAIKSGQIGSRRQLAETLQTLTQMLRSGVDTPGTLRRMAVLSLAGLAVEVGALQTFRKPIAGHAAITAAALERGQ